MKEELTRFARLAVEELSRRAAAGSTGYLEPAPAPTDGRLKAPGVNFFPVEVVALDGAVAAAALTTPLRFRTCAPRPVPPVRRCPFHAS